MVREKLAVLLVGIHPLRVETLAWASCFPFHIAMLFSLLAALCQLEHYQRRRYASPLGPWRLASAACFAIACLSKPAALGVAPFLLLLDAILVDAEKFKWLIDEEPKDAPPPPPGREGVPFVAKHKLSGKAAAELASGLPAPALRPVVDCILRECRTGWQTFGPARHARRVRASRCRAHVRARGPSRQPPRAICGVERRRLCHVSPRRSALDRSSPWVASLRAHRSYWGSKDTMLFVLSRLLHGGHGAAASRTAAPERADAPAAAPAQPPPPHEEGVASEAM